MKQPSEQYCVLKSIINMELQEIDDEMATQDNTEISSVVAFHIEHGVRDVEKRLAENGSTELELPYGISDDLKASMNQLLLNVEALLRYYYRACYFGTMNEVAQYRQEILRQLELMK